MNELATLMELFSDYSLDFNTVTSSILVKYKGVVTFTLGYNYESSQLEPSSSRPGDGYLSLVQSLIESIVQSKIKIIQNLGIPKDKEFITLVWILKDMLSGREVSIEKDVIESNQELKDLIKDLSIKLSKSSTLFTGFVPIHYSSYSLGYSKKSCSDNLNALENTYRELLRFTESLQQNYNSIILEYTTWRNNISDLLSKLIGKL